MTCRCHGYISVIRTFESVGALDGLDASVGYPCDATDQKAPSRKVA